MKKLTGSSSNHFYNSVLNLTLKSDVRRYKEELKIVCYTFEQLKADFWQEL